MDVVLIPAYEPDEELVKLVPRLKEAGFAVLVVDDGSGDGYYACGGKLIKIQWHHENPADPFTFTLEDGTPLVQGIGSSYIGICPLKSTVEWE